jgi:phage terminase small subunit
MDTLTQKQRAFVDAFVQLGGKHQEKAALAAGYSKSGAASIASHLLRRPDVLAYLKHVAETRVKAGIVRSVEVLETLRDDVSISPETRRKCAEVLLGHAGLIVARVSETTIRVEETRDQQIAEVLRLCKANGVDPAVLGLGGLVAFVGRDRAEKLAAPRDVIDVEAEPIETGQQMAVSDLDPIASETGSLSRENPLDPDDLSDLL